MIQLILLIVLIIVSIKAVSTITKVFALGQTTTGFILIILYGIIAMATVVLMGVV